jgi:hypothetical protein
MLCLIPRSTGCPTDIVRFRSFVTPCHPLLAKRRLPVKRLVPALVLLGLLLTLASIESAWADTQQAAQSAATTCPWRQALVSHDRQIGVEGSTAAVEFEVAEGCTVELSLVSYEAPAPDFDPSLADQQKLFAAKTDVYGPGEHRVEVALPDCFWQVDFVAGTPIKDLSPTNLYGRRLIAGRSGGEACVEPTTTTAPPPPPGEATTTSALLGATSTSTPGKLPFTGAATMPMVLAGLGLLGGGLLILRISRAHGRITS